MTEKITEFFKQHWPRAATAPATVAAVVLAAALAVAFLSLWLAKITGVNYAFLRLVDAVLSPTVVAVGVVAGAFVWFVNKFSDEIRNLINRLRKFGNTEFTEQPSPLATGSAAEGKSGNGATLESSGTAPAGDSFAEIKIKAEENDAEAQFNLGVRYATGQGVARNEVEAIKWIRLAAEQGFALAQNNLGARYVNGWGVAQDDAEAVKWFRAAAEQGFSKAQFNLGQMYRDGRNVPQNDAEAVKWYRRAAEKEYAPAQTNLGWMYYNGRGVPQDDAEAVKWYRRAAEQGLAHAQTNLGWMYHNGRGVPQNYWEAYVWHSIAAANRDKDAVQLRDSSAKLLSADDLAKAQAEAGRRLEEIRKQAESGK